jgi:hypothetical protein
MKDEGFAKHSRREYEMKIVRGATVECALKVTLDGDDDGIKVSVDGSSVPRLAQVSVKCPS